MRSINTSAKLAGLKLAISMMDLTRLKGKDTPGKIACRRGLREHLQHFPRGVVFLKCG
jgi:deoxyribose-phosphate aldolase